MTNYQWVFPDILRPPVNGEVHIWRFKLNLENEDYHQLSAFLSENELQRANKLYNEKLKQRYIAARGQLKILLGKYLGVSPKSLFFTLNEYGKPYLSQSFSGFYFNISHSGDMALAGFSAEFEVGVDIEYRRPSWNGMHIARRFFSKDETEALYTLPVGKQRRAFFDCWCRKEAYIKARGTGLATPLKQFTVSVNPQQPARLLSTEHDPLAVKEWTLKDIPVNQEYSGAAVVHAVNWQPRLFDAIHINKLMNG
ncbi:MAG: 4'-phosphopantetheinyl transferase superfamily protein [Calditrichaceae bacterium]|nr:4'-phosphopantetheinyl transferase superfamily protein [Calditrichaceae bacterium]MBN2707548.1 4'-phosphopantetheinyl transferase superfamily protein [Calditrichaceae bacterium]RQV95634.1 MAG: 4'-phosphopantetheinyl transferase superfamily protein [Calditrichota bacterium]